MAQSTGGTLCFSMKLLWQALHPPVRRPRPQQSVSTREMPQAGFPAFTKLAMEIQGRLWTFDQWQRLTARVYRKQQAPPKAWQGPNPITQRASSTLSNGTEKPLPKLPPQAQSKSSGDSHAEKHAHDRLLYIVAHFTVRLQEPVGIRLCDRLQLPQLHTR